MSDAANGADRATDTRGKASAIGMALAVIALGAFVSCDSVTGLTGPGYAQVGPGVFPVIVGAALLLAGTALLAQAIRGSWRVVWVEGYDLSAHSRASGNPGPSPAVLAPRFRGDEWLPVLLIAAALILNVFLFQSLGFVLASAVLFTCVSAAFGSRRFVLDIAIGIAFTAAIYLVFAKGLGLQLPTGDLWGSLPWTH
jgi:putative tricarboxylic transport membrane protein